MSEDGDVIIKGAQGITGTPHDSSFTIGIVLLLITLFIVLNLTIPETDVPSWQFVTIPLRRNP